MQITISGKQLNLSDALREHAELHMNDMSAKYFDRALEAQVTFGRTRAFFTCDIHLHPGKSLEMHGTGEGATAQAAFDAAAAHAAKQLRRYRRRANEHGAVTKVDEEAK
jgi:ribosomal subunit interface protein